MCKRSSQRLFGGVPAWPDADYLTSCKGWNQILSNLQMACLGTIQRVHESSALSKQLFRVISGVVYADHYYLYQAAYVTNGTLYGQAEEDIRRCPYGSKGLTQSSRSSAEDAEERTLHSSMFIVYVGHKRCDLPTKLLLGFCVS